jgi:hypothetical protein
VSIVFTETARIAACDARQRASSLGLWLAGALLSRAAHRDSARAGVRTAAQHTMASSAAHQLCAAAELQRCVVASLMSPCVHHDAADILSMSLPDQCQEPPESPLLPAVLIAANVNVRRERFEVMPQA